MTEKINRTKTFHRSCLWAGALLGAIAGSVAAQTAPPNHYLVHNLVSDLPGIADHQDAKLKNPWGNGFGSTPFWVGNNGSGTATVYDGTGAATPLVVGIPQANGAGQTGPVTGVIFNSFSSNANAFDVQDGKSSNFIFCSLDGVISGWNGSVSGTNASILFDNSKSGAVYPGCTLGGTAAAPFLFAANFNSGKIDVYDRSLKLNPAPYANAFSNPSVPSGFAPFNVENINGTLFVAYAKQDSQKQHDVAGAGNGYVAMFSMSGNLIANFISQGPLNSPWGMAIAPANFGTFAGALLVGNFGDGAINAFNATTGAALGTLKDTNDKPIAIQGLWSLAFGSGTRNEDPGTLYITAGIGGGPNNDPIQTHGLLASIQAAPSFQTSGVVNGASGLAGPIAPNTWVELKGSGMSATTGSWQVTGATLPTTVNGVGVTVNGQAVPVNFVSNTLVEFLVPSSTSAGTAQIQTTNNGLTSATVTATVAQLAPGFFIAGTNTASGDNYIAATHADGSLLGNPATVKNSTPAAPGEIVVLYATGFGQAMGSTGPLAAIPTVVMDGIAADVAFAGLVGPGLYQFNVKVPETVVRGQDVLVIGLSGNAVTQPNAFIPIAAQ